MTQAETHKLWPLSSGAQSVKCDNDCANLAASSAYSIAFQPVLQQAPAPQIVMLRRLFEGGALLDETELWTWEFSSASEARRIIHWMQRDSREWQAWGRLSSVLGADQLIIWLEQQAKRERAERLESLREHRMSIALERRKQERRREKEKEVNSYLVDDEDQRQFGVDLRRGGHKTGFFVIWFRERWERERFRDWWRCQKPRFSEFAAFLEKHGAAALERKLLQEMLLIEKKVKQSGMSAGGRRPLRFYRGED